MAHVYRLILCFFGFFPAVSFAVVPMVGKWYNSSNFGGYFSTAQGACAALNDKPPNKDYGWTFTAVNVTSTRADCMMQDGRYGAVAYATLSCPENSISSGNSCTCNTGFEEKNGQCIKPVDRSKEKACGSDFIYAGWGLGFGKYVDSWVLNGKITSGQKCDPFTDAKPGGTGCKVDFMASGYTKNDDGSWTTVGKFSAVSGENPGEGVPCTPTYEGEGVDVVADKDKSPCEGYKGTVNGIEQCIANSKNNGVEWAKTEQTEKKSDGTTIETKVEQKCEGDKCTTTTTTTKKDASGNVVGVDVTSKTQGTSEFCKENADKCNGKGQPGVNKGTSSKDGSGGEDDDEKKGSFSGNCQAGFSCEGDAITCAIAKEIHTRNCQVDDLEKSDLYRAWSNVKDFGDKNVTADLPGNKEHTIQLTDGDEFIGAGSCPPDRVLELGSFGSITLPFSELCPWLQTMGYVFLILCSIQGAHTIIRRQS